MWGLFPKSEAQRRAEAREAKLARDAALLEAGGRKEAFLDAEGVLRFRVLPKRRFHDREAEQRQVLALDSAKVEVGGRWCLIDAAWLASWLRFVAQKRLPPEEITNHRLCGPDGRVRAGLRIKEDFRAVTTGVFAVLQELYGGGPAIFVSVPSSEQATAWLAKADMREEAVADASESSVPEADEGSSSEERWLVAKYKARTQSFSDSESDGDELPLAFAPRGWLQLVDVDAGTQRRRFFVLEGGALKEFADDSCRPPATCALPVGSITRISQSNDHRVPEFTVEIVATVGFATANPELRILLSASASEELEGWLTALHAAIAEHDEEVTRRLSPSRRPAAAAVQVPAQLPVAPPVIDSSAEGRGLLAGGLLAGSDTDSSSDTEGAFAPPPSTRSSKGLGPVPAKSSRPSGAGWTRVVQA